MKKLTYALTMLLAGAAQAANFGPSPFTSDDPAVTVTAVNANTTTGALALTVNGVNYSGVVQYLPVAVVGSVQYYQSTPAVLFSLDNTRHLTVSVMASHWTTRTSSGRGGGYNYQHYAVSGGSVAP